MTKVATNQALLKVLGIDQPLITALQIQMHPTNLPVVTMEYLLDGKALQPTAAQFDLVLREEAAPAPAPKLDLDAMCAAAQQRIAEAADNAAFRAKCEHLGDSKLIRARLDQALQRRRLKVTAALAMLDLSPLVKALAHQATASGIFGGTLGGLVGIDLADAFAAKYQGLPNGRTRGGGRK